MAGWIWQQQIDELSKKYLMIAVDPRSRGESDKPNYGHLPETRARDYKELVDQFRPCSPRILEAVCSKRSRLLVARVC